MSKPIIVGISGGVDSSVSAFTLKEKGYDIECIFMKNWDGNEESCTSEEDYKDALLVCDRIDVPLRTVNFAKEYWDNVFQYFLSEHSKNRTPNPDVICNREIKFNSFLNYSIELGAKKIATGHYAQINKKDGLYTLHKGKDNTKDQSYFLCSLNQRALSRSIFPIGDISKDRVRQIARDNNLLNHSKKDSTGICFIGEQAHFKKFLKKYIPEKPGLIKTADGITCGQHDGLMYYTIGQRKGLGIGGGYGSSELPWFVVDKNIKENVLVVAQGHDHPALYHSTLTVSNFNWISGTPSKKNSLTAKIRYRQNDQNCNIDVLSKDKIHIKFDEPQFAITPGQFAVLYDNDECLGGGIIDDRK